MVRYRLFPFLLQTVVWISEPEDRWLVDPHAVGFVPCRTRPVLRDLAAHGWSVEVRTVSWVSGVSWIVNRVRRWLPTNH